MDTRSQPLDLILTDFALVRSFIGVVEHGNLTRAAKHLNMAQPTVGRHIRRLESIMGEVLFDRAAQGFRPTARAVELFEKAQALDSAFVAFGQAIRGTQDGIRGRVRITTTHAFGSTLLPGILRDLLHANPGLEVEISLNDRPENLLRREADIAVRFVEPQQDDLIARRLGQLSLGLFAHRSYFTDLGLPIPRTPADLVGHLIIGDEQASRALSFAKTHDIAIGKTAVRLRSESMTTQLAAIRSGIGIGPALLCATRGEPDLVRIIPDLAVATLPVWIVAHDDLNRSPRMRFVFDHLVDRISMITD